MVRPLYFRLLNEVQTAYAKERLCKVLEKYGWRLDTDFLSTPLIHLAFLQIFIYNII